MQPDEILARLDGVHPSGDGWVARCPAHDDHRQSLSLGVGDDGRVLVNCHAGCAPDAVCEALGLKLADLFVEEPGGNGKRREIVATYDYVDESRQLLYQVVRFEPKDFRQRRPDGKGGWTWKVAGTRRVLYRLPEVLLASRLGGTVYVVEGEKDVHAIEAAGAVATTSPAGAGKWRSEYSEALTGAHVAIVADRDEPGREHAEKVARSLEGKAASVCILEAAVGKDAADHLAAGRSLGELVAPAWSQADEGRESPFIDWVAFWRREHSEVEWTYDDVLARGRGHAMYAGHKTGKSLLMLWIAAQVVQRPTDAVLYLDYEMSEADLFDRLDDMGFGEQTDFSRLRYALLPSLPPLDTNEGAEAVMALCELAVRDLGDVQLTVVMDTASRAVRGEEDKADTWRAFYSCTGIRLKRAGYTWVRLDHAGKDATRGQRGSSGKGDDVDVIWKLSKTQNGLELKREAARMSWVPERVLFKRSNNPLRYLRMVQDWPEGTQETALHLDRLKADPMITVRSAKQLLKDHGVGVSSSVTAAAVRWRKQREGAQ